MAGYAGASAITAARRMVVTDDDLFPPGTVSLNGLKLYGEEIGKVVSYAATAAQAAGSQLTPLFDQLLASEGGTHLAFGGPAFLRGRRHRRYHPWGICHHGQRLFHEKAPCVPAP